MSPRKKKKKAAKGSLLTRLFGAGGKGSAKEKPKVKKAGAATGSNGKAPAQDGRQSPAPAKARPLTPLERSIEEVRRMMKVGESDPQRLAMLLSNLLGTEKQKRQQDQQKFDDMVLGIVRKREGTSEDG
ncbi:hypothetical protein ACFL6X_03015 [Candidatus Latescibacterota bacterium]